MDKPSTMKCLHMSSCPRRMESRQQSLAMRRCPPRIRCMRSHRQTARCLRNTNKLLSWSMSWSPRDSSHCKIQRPPRSKCPRDKPRMMKSLLQHSFPRNKHCKMKSHSPARCLRDSCTRSRSCHCLPIPASHLQKLLLLPRCPRLPHSPHRQTLLAEATMRPWLWILRW